MKKSIWIALFLFLSFSTVVLAGWKDWTPAQKTAVKNWIKAQPKKGTVILKQAINARPVTGWNDWDEVLPRDPIVVMSEKANEILEAVYDIPAEKVVMIDDNWLRPNLSSTA